MLFGHKHLDDDALCKNMITINSNTLERVKVVKFLGILIDDKNGLESSHFSCCLKGC